MENITDHIKHKAEIFLRNDLRVFIKDIFDNYHFCMINEICTDWVIIKHFKGTRAGENLRILWIDIKIFEEYKELKE